MPCLLLGFDAIIPSENENSCRLKLFKFPQSDTNFFNCPAA